MVDIKHVELNGLTAIVNGETIALADKPSFNTGGAKIIANPTMVGANISIVYGLDYTEAIGRVTLPLRNTKPNMEKIEDWRNNLGSNSIRVLDNESGFSISFPNMSIMESPDIDLKSNMTEVKFEGGIGK